MKEIADRGLRIADLQSQSSVTPKTRRYGTGSGSDLAPTEPVLDGAPGRYRSLYRTSAIRNPQSIELHIEELVVDGFAPDNRERFVAAVESELARLLGERGISGSLTEDIEVEQLTGSALRIRQDETSETTGQHLAQAIYARMIGGLR